MTILLLDFIRVILLFQTQILSENSVHNIGTDRLVLFCLLCLSVSYILYDSQHHLIVVHGWRFRGFAGFLRCDVHDCNNHIPGYFHDYDSHARDYLQNCDDYDVRGHANVHHLDCDNHDCDQTNRYDLHADVHHVHDRDHNDHDRDYDDHDRDCDDHDRDHNEHDHDDRDRDRDHDDRSHDCGYGDHDYDRHRPYCGYGYRDCAIHYGYAFAKRTVIRY
ncbi:unnamed protein product [Acanthocheilonema viteae]|uniref:Uncharacterized protein n=1 Tax=Acanthocheilonema viteae TaxID=6277 RepID=A0A498SL24_ACAVI|nr:unnamed protein product [Acanthocheilonema viteae]